jgi:hypothetical protein
VVVSGGEDSNDWHRKKWLHHFFKPKKYTLVIIYSATEFQVCHIAVGGFIGSTIYQGLIVVTRADSIVFNFENEVVESIVLLTRPTITTGFCIID